MQDYKNEACGFSIAVPAKEYKQVNNKSQKTLFYFQGTGKIFLVDYRPLVLESKELKALNAKFFNKKLAALEAKGYTILLKEQLTIAKQPAIHFAYYLPEKEQGIFDDYLITTTNGIYRLSYLGNRNIYPLDEKLFLPKIIKSIKITPLSSDIYKRPFTTRTIKDIPATFTTPANCIPIPVKNDPYHKIAYADGYFFASPMVVNIADVEELNFYPHSFANLSEAAKQNLISKEIERMQLKAAARQKENPKHKRDNIKAEFVTINGENCLKVSYDLSMSTEVDYIFVRDGKFISFDYQYPFKDTKKLKTAVDKSANSIRFTN